MSLGHGKRVMDDYGYGLWALVVVHSLIFIIFAASSFHPRSSRDWRVLGGFWLIAAGWRVLFAALKAETLATTGPYARLHHPQYAGFVLIMIGFLLQWPRLATLVMFPVLLVVYRRLAMREEREIEARFGESWRSYEARTPRFFARLGPLPAPAGRS